MPITYGHALSLVKMETEELINSTTLSGSPIVAVSATSGDGLDELVATIDKLLDSAESRKDVGRPRLAIDRVFTIAGSGTVVTGTLIDGSLSVGQEVEIVPSGLKSRIRGLQTHKTKEDTASPGSRVAANLVGVSTSQLKRGDVVTRPGWLSPTTVMTVKLRLLSYLNRPLRHNAAVSFHTGAAETMAKVRLLEGDELLPGDTGWAQLSLKEPVAAVKGDRYIIRSTMETLGGGDILDAHAKRLRRKRPAIIESLKVKEEGTVEEIIVASLEAKQSEELTALLAQIALPESEVRPVVESLIQGGEITGIGQGEHRLLFSTPGWERLIDRASALARDYHQRFPARTGMPKVELGSRLKLGTHVSAVLQRLTDKGVIVEDGAAVRLPEHRIRLTQAQQTKVDTFLHSLVRNPYDPPSELIPEPDLLNLLVEQGKVVKVIDGVVFSSAVYDEMVDGVVSHIKAQGKVTLGEVRDLFKTSRKYAQPFLEYLDRAKITRRVGDERVLY